MTADAGVPESGQDPLPSSTEMRNSLAPGPCDGSPSAAIWRWRQASSADV